MNTLKQQVDAARCPVCGSGVFHPSLADRFGGDNGDDIQVWCRDMGHWIGFLSDCKKVQ